MTDTPEYCTICGDKMDNVIEDVWMCRDEDPHFFQCRASWGWSAFEEIHYFPTKLAGTLARALLAEQERAGKLASVLRESLNF
jgi:hypothetical protein